MTSKPIELDEERVLWFRARRTHLAGPGGDDARAAARRVLGAQSQQLKPSLHALCLRSAARETTRTLEARLVGDARDLVRTWGQRETVHVYAVEDWPLVVAARAEWAPPARPGPRLEPALVKAARRVLAASDGAITRDDLLPVVPRAYARELARHTGSEETGARAAAGRLIGALAQRGEVCMATKRGAQQAYAARAAWFPDLEWPELDARAANLALARRYLALHAPASAADLAHHLGARVTTARAWLADLAPELVEVRCGGRAGLAAPARDLDALREPVPRGATAWPLRLLPQWDTQLMAHADKSWLAPDAAEHAAIWAKAGVVRATALARGRLVATWTHAKRGKALELEVTPLGGWRAAKHAKPVQREADALAAHLGLAEARVNCARA